MIKPNRIFTIKNGLKTIWIIYAIFSIMIWLPKIDNLLKKDYAEISKHILLDDDWNITINDKFYQDVSLDDFQFTPVKKGDQITMQRQLPGDWENIIEGVLRLHIRQTSVNIYIDDELIYEYGSDRVNQNKTVGSGFQFINFPDKYKGKSIRIELYVSENNALARFDSIRIYDWKNAYRVLLTENRLPMFLGSFLVIFGLSIVMITTFAVLQSRKYIRIFCISAFSICMGLWTLAYYNVILVYSIPLYSVSLIEYMALYLSPLPLIIYMHKNVKNLKNKILKTIYWILFTVQMVFDVIILTLHTKDIVHCAAVLKYFHILIICHLIYFTLILIISLKTSERLNRFYLVGMLIIAGCTGYDLVTYYYNRYLGDTFLTLKGVSAIGVMIFIFILIYTFYANLTEKMMKETERNSLIKSAYTDDLTQLSNRRYCSEYMKKIQVEGIPEYTVVCFDLNNLKTTNDTYGHAKGDLLIQSAADVLLETFKGHGIVGRMGGDEFIAILTDSYKETIEVLINKFIDNIGRKNQEIADLNLSISYGYALSCESEEKNIEKIYQIADDRMYKNKRQYKKQKAK
ncbi:MAG: GGDEF domain-containing protein [Lachnospiraceae bacterium]|nr:GGDEF domain-containing protein [Lachnospiraceae bacterium]